MSTGPLFCILVLFDRWATAYRDVDAPTSRAVVKGKLDRPSSEECRADASEHRTWAHKEPREGIYRLSAVKERAACKLKPCT